MSTAEVEVVTREMRRLMDRRRSIWTADQKSLLKSVIDSLERVARFNDESEAWRRQRQAVTHAPPEPAATVAFRKRTAPLVTEAEYQQRKQARRRAQA